MEKLDLKKKWKALYGSKAGCFEFVEVPPLRYLMVDGEGDPNTSVSFQQAIEVLYALSYALKFSLKKSPNPTDWSVMPLEGPWWADDPGDFLRRDKSKWRWTAMILQPDLVGSAHVETAIEEVRRKRNPAALDRVRLEVLDEGSAVQVLYLGAFSGEGPVIQKMHEMIHEAGKQIFGKHHEIYLSDPRRTAPEKLRTIIRQPMR